MCLLTGLINLCTRCTHDELVPEEPQKVSYWCHDCNDKQHQDVEAVF